MEIRSYLAQNILLFDGAMGTYYGARNPQAEGSCELANLTHPQEILAIHRAYLEAGCRAIKTNTFGANRKTMGQARCQEVLEAGYRLARQAAGENAFVFADMGPITVTDNGNLLEEYRFLVDCFLALGARNFLLETNGREEGLHETAAYIKERQPEAFVILSFGAQPDGFTRSGQLVGRLYQRAAQDPNVDGAGLNCVSGARHMAELVSTLELSADTFLSVMPNAGYPTVLGGRT